MLMSKIALRLGFSATNWTLVCAPRQAVNSQTSLRHRIPCKNNLCQATAARVLRGRRFTEHSLATCLKCQVFSEQSHRTTHKTTLSVISASFFVPAAPRGLFYHASGKGFRALGLSESTVVRTTVVFVLGRAFLRAISEPFVAPNACI